MGGWTLNRIDQGSDGGTGVLGRTLCWSCKEAWEAASSRDGNKTRTCPDCGEQLDRSRPADYCPECERQVSEARAKSAARGFGIGLVVLAICAAGFGQTSYSGRGSGLGEAQMGAAASLPLTYPARTDVCELGTETGPLGCAANPTNPVNCPSCSGPATALPMIFTGSPNPGVPGTHGLPIPGPTSGSSCGAQGASTNNQYLCGMNTWVRDADFNTELTRATDYTMAGVQGRGFDMMSDGAYKLWASDDSKLFVENTGGSFALLAFYPSQWHPASPSPTSGPVWTTPIYGTAIYGIPAFSATNPHVFYTFNTDQENTVVGSMTSGMCQTPETVQQNSTGASATLQAINPTVLMQIGAVTGGANNSNTWVGQSSGCVFTPNPAYATPLTNPPYANTIYAGAVDDATYPNTPSNWTATYSLLFNFNYVNALAGLSGSGAPYGPASPNSCLPVNFNGKWSGVFQPSNDGTMFGTSIGDNGQAGAWGPALSSCATSGPDGHGWIGSGICAGATYDIEYKTGSGCRVWNTHTDQIWGDWGTSGQAQDGQYRYITGTMSGTPTQLPSSGVSGALLVQDGTGATTEYKGSGYVASYTAPSGYSYQQYQTDTQQTATSWKTGVIYGAADATHTWRAQDGSAAYISSSALPMPTPFYYPGSLHAGVQQDGPTSASITKSNDMDYRVLTVAANAATHMTTLTLAISACSPQPCSASPAYASATIPIDQVRHFYQLGGAHDQYLNCTDANHCPAFPVVNGTSNTGSTQFPGTANNYTIVIRDNIASSSYSDTEPTETTTCYGTPLGKTGGCAIMTMAGPGYGSDGFSYMNNPMFWVVSGTTVTTCLSLQCQSHAAHGYTGDARGAYYDWYNFTNPSTPCTNSGGIVVTGYTPCPGADLLPLLQTSFPEDDHGAYNNHGPYDLAPMFAFLAHMCGQGSGTGSNACYSPFSAAWEDEVIGIENSVTNNANGQCGSAPGPGCHCNYGSGPTACVYRFHHSFNSDAIWEFEARNTTGEVSSDGQYAAFPSSWMDSLGCANGTTTCWSSYIASGPPTVTMTGATLQVSSGVATVTMPSGTYNQFCSPNGKQYYWDSVNNVVDTIACGALAEQVTLGGFAESWANGTITLSAVGGCDSTDSNAGNCTSFSWNVGTPSSYGPVTESGTQTAVPVTCTSGGTGTYCQRPDIWITKLGSAQ